MIVTKADEDKDRQLGGDDLRRSKVSIKARVATSHGCTHLADEISSCRRLEDSYTHELQARTVSSAVSFFLPATHEVAGNALDKDLTPVGVQLICCEINDIRPIRLTVEDARRLQLDKVSRALEA